MKNQTLLSDRSDISYDWTILAINVSSFVELTDFPVFKRSCAQYAHSTKKGQCYGKKYTRYFNPALILFVLFKTARLAFNILTYEQNLGIFSTHIRHFQIFIIRNQNDCIFLRNNRLYRKESFLLPFFIFHEKRTVTNYTEKNISEFFLFFYVLKRIVFFSGFPI